MSPDIWPDQRTELLKPLRHNGHTLEEEENKRNGSRWVSCGLQEKLPLRALPVPPKSSLIFHPTHPAVSYGGRGTHHAAFPDSQGLRDAPPREVMDEPPLGAGFVPTGPG